MTAAPTALLKVHVQPRCRTTSVVGRHGDAIKIRLKAPPVDGAANDELVRFLAERLGVPRRAVAVIGGAATRAKRVSVAGLDLREAERRLVG